MLLQVVLILPTYYPVTDQNLNYAIILLGGVTILASIVWILSARKWFKGPVRWVPHQKSQAVSVLVCTLSAPLWP